MTQSLPGKVEQFRTLHPTLRYESYSIALVPEGLRLEYTFLLEPSYVFTPSIIIPCTSIDPDQTTERLAFLIGMVELMSYWKLSCSPRIDVRAGPLSSQEIIFWKQLFQNGLGEFFYVNQIPPSIEFEISAAELAPTPVVTSSPSGDSFLILVGGGKDSVVTLELLKRYSKTRDLRLASFTLNPIPASINAIQAAGYPSPLVAARRLDPKLLELNAKGYLNGHTPFSALLALVSTLTAHLHGFRYVLASNESSASEGNVSYYGVDINHQYSKSLEFERLFRDYMCSMLLGIEYSSFLRPINELQICALFSTFSHQHTVFRSCNREQTLRARQQESSLSTAANKVSGWCAECPKCIFTYLCLSCFLPQERLVEIFGVNLSNTSNFTAIAKELAGFATHKPFECVGTFEEVRAALNHLLSTGALCESSNGSLRELRSHLRSTSTAPIREIVSRWSMQHFAPEEPTEFMRQQLKHAAERLT